MKVLLRVFNLFNKREVLYPVSFAKFQPRIYAPIHISYRSLGRRYCSEEDESSKEASDDELEVNERDPLYTDIKKIYHCPIMGHNVFLIQPRIKFGPKCTSKIEATLKQNEAVALVETIPDWKVVEKCIVPVNSLSSSLVFGKGNLEKLKLMLEQKPHISAICIGFDMITAVQVTKLEEFFGVPIFDRYQIVLRIFHYHARTKEAKLQIALAEIPYLRIKLAAFSHTFDYNKFQEVNHVVGGMGETVMDTRRQILSEREQKLKRALEKLRKQREFLRQNEKRNEYPIVAVVGYTNSGKTSLIKSLTHDARLTPEDKLFATLDVTFHAGILPSAQKVLYVDTVGFISDVPTTLIHCFKATLEDATMADLIIHVRDISHPDTEMQKKVVLQTLNDLKLPEKLRNSIIEVGNKVDLLENTEHIEDKGILLISALEGNNLNNLIETIEESILKNTDHQVHLLRVPNGGEEYRWLQKEAAIRDAIADERDYNYLIVEVVISSAKMAKFTHSFGNLTITIDQIANR